MKLCPKCVHQSGYFTGLRHVPARKRHRLWYAPWRFTDATPETMQWTCRNCGYLDSFRPGTVSVNFAPKTESWQ